jgi:hypothetical protein
LKNRVSVTGIMRLKSKAEIWHHHHISVMELGHLLTCSGLTYPEVSSKVCHDSFRQLGNSVSLPWVIYYGAFYLHLVPKFIMCRNLLLGYYGGEVRHSNNSAVILITSCTTICPYYYSSLYKDCRAYHVDTETNHAMF